MELYVLSRLSLSGQWDPSVIHLHLHSTHTDITMRKQCSATPSPPSPPPLSHSAMHLIRSRVYNTLDKINTVASPHNWNWCTERPNYSLIFFYLIWHVSNSTSFITSYHLSFINNSNSNFNWRREKECIKSHPHY